MLEIRKFWGYVGLGVVFGILMWLLFLSLPDSLPAIVMLLVLGLFALGFASIREIAT